MPTDRPDTSAPKPATTSKLEDYAAYPNSPTHAWNAFAFLAIEAEGYNDLTATNPYTGDLIHVYAWHGTDNPYTALRALVDAMEAVDFLPTPKDEDNG